MVRALKNPCRDCSEEPTICYGKNPACSAYAEYSAALDQALKQAFCTDQECVWRTQDGECEGQCLKEKKE